MTDASVAADFLQSLDVQCDLSSQITFNSHGFVDHFADLLNPHRLSGLCSECRD